MRSLPCSILPLLLVASLAAQGCDGRGSDLVAARWEPGLPLLCPYAPEAPGYWLYTPAHRELVPRAGMQPGTAHVRSQWIIRYRCTGLWLVPVVVSEVRAYGIILDVEEQACAVAPPPPRG
jgi:hypothetical protein